MSDTSALFDTLLRRITASFAEQPDKPEETPEGTVKALWLAAAGTPVAIEATADATLPSLDAAQAAALACGSSFHQSGFSPAS